MTARARNGTTAAELDAILVAPLLFILISECLCWIVASCLTARSRQLQIFKSVLNFFIEYFAQTLPLLMMYTVAADFKVAIYAVTGVLSLALLFACLRVQKQSFTAVWSKMRASCRHDVGRQFLANYRAYIFLSTIICILAVDFVVFPWRFTKTETYGKGLMDLGVGCYVISGAVVSKEARHCVQSDLTVRSSLRSLQPAFKTSSLLMLLGIGRYASTHLTKYHATAVTEYGVHWNFFVTLAVVRIVSAIILATTRRISVWVWFVAILACHQLLLMTYLTAYVSQKDARKEAGFWGLVAANREGVVACPGFVALHMGGVGIGRMLVKAGCLRGDNKPSADQGSGCSGSHSLTNSEPKKLEPTDNGRLLMSIATWSVVALVTCVGFEYWIEPVSRKTANAAYILWTMHLNLLLMSVTFLASVVLNSFMANPQDNGSVDSEDVWQRSLCSLLAAVSDRGLVLFLAANLITGLVNLSIKTLSVSAPAAILTLAVYLLVNCLIAKLLQWLLQARAPPRDNCSLTGSSM